MPSRVNKNRSTKASARWSFVFFQGSRKVSLEYVEALRSGAHFFGPRKSRCGIYLLWFADGFSYIGKADDVVRRFGQHRAVHSDIVAFSFQEVERILLDRRERTLIREAETRGLLLRNGGAVRISHRSHLYLPEYGTTRFDGSSSAKPLSENGRLIYVATDDR